MIADEPFLGILMLDAAFARYPGDVGNPATWDIPVRFRHVSGATPRRIVGITETDFVDAFVAAANGLVDEGAAGISTSCGFLAAYQAELTSRIKVPVITSSLCLQPLMAITLPKGRKVGILTFDAKSLLPAHMAAAGIGDDLPPVQGLPAGGRFQRALLDDDRDHDGFDEREAEVLWAAEELVRRHPEVGAILCECTNLSPHSAAIARRLALPVHDIVTTLNWFYAGLRPKSFPQPKAASHAAR
jgi:hypothetical protein